MKEKVKISIDLMGGENSPNKTLEGINLFMKRNNKIDDCFFYLFGEKKIVEEKIKKISLIYITFITNQNTNTWYP